MTGNNSHKDVSFCWIWRQNFDFLLFYSVAFTTKRNWIQFYYHKNTNPDRQRKPAAVPSPTGKLHSTDSSRQTEYSAKPKKPLVAHSNASSTPSSAYWASCSTKSNHCCVRHVLLSHQVSAASSASSPSSPSSSSSSRNLQCTWWKRSITSQSGDHQSTVQQWCVQQCSLSMKMVATEQSLASIAPTYLISDIHLVFEHGRRLLHSSTDRTLTVPRTHNRFGDRSFAVAGPRLWNSLPLSLRKISSYGQFRRYLKNHLFGIWEITMQCDAWYPALYKYSYLLTYLQTVSEACL